MTMSQTNFFILVHCLLNKFIQMFHIWFTDWLEKLFKPIIISIWFQQWNESQQKIICIFSEYKIWIISIQKAWIKSIHLLRITDFVEQWTKTKYISLIWMKQQRTLSHHIKIFETVFQENLAYTANIYIAVHFFELILTFRVEASSIRWHCRDRTHTQQK